MEETDVVIVGAGPSGLALGLALAKFRIRSIILEKENGMTADPRGVYLTGDAIRILHDLGIGHDMSNIGHEVHKVNFHKSSFAEKEFFSLNIGTSNILKQAVPEGMLQSQPRLENALRKEALRSEMCTLRTGCTVVSRSSDDPPTIEYVTEDDVRRQIRGQYLVGADGKVGIVRKHFLEPTAGIQQEEGIYRYNGTWIAANLKISPPTAQTHPQFPLWKLGYSSDEVYDLFWPEGWHFCSPPGKATACGRFGPHSDRIWRHELCQEDWDESMDAEALFWDHITPMITRRNDEKGHNFSDAVVFPRDCIKILRCRPFRFTHKVVNRWFHKRTILIGDAAHVFPPFAGQGIASGVRDAHQLAWRLALLLRSSLPCQRRVSLSDALLNTWALERRKSVDGAALFSMLNGMLCNHKPSLWLLVVLRLQTLLESIPFLPSLPDPQGWTEKRAFTGVKGGFFLKEYNGGARLAQIRVQSSSNQVPVLSDLLLKSDSILTVLVISNSNDHGKLYEDARAAVAAADIDSTIVSEDSIVGFTPCANYSNAPTSTHRPGKNQAEVFWPVVHPTSMESSTLGFDDGSYIDRLGRRNRFCLVRPDFFVFACARDKGELVKCLALLKQRLYEV
ncbi:monooxygenase-like protein [Dactylonectria estremocensis]|uniref:Monooxygenase-like protein n=1 Tax=Dactylonectria estremocensis TaxID=1079267 RepID=A0A9P9IZN3_9HYPO|nr:monooxygenase-like protein [Dactylonectria estremocensis]